MWWVLCMQLFSLLQRSLRNNKTKRHYHIQFLVPGSGQDSNQGTPSSLSKGLAKPPVELAALHPGFKAVPQGIGRRIMTFGGNHSFTKDELMHCADLLEHVGG
ncbi:uncharacterized protein CIMG_13101 [Coccidioides immitis RS]|uniref:Uncharacterized protein n=1 Tax=Coccidioides immitis (strain RS) TaxID=246410 RepID=A0A0D8JUS0_COCIM|nr:uncharacterized protein CIMG_13101 [Coccidioides immitis RS]KJF60656.1 hypothetical protein CIMG_13101 [Coccidioides immitis RS]